MAKDSKNNRLFDLPETKGQFQVRGIVSGTDKDNFYKELTIKNNKPMRMVNFGLQFDKEVTMYAGFNGMEQDNVYFSATEKTEDGKSKTIVEKVPWKDRFTFKKEGFRPIGVNIGVKKILDEKGKKVNDKKVLSQYDACKEVGDNLQDGESVFVKGNITYSTYENKHQTRFEPNQISLCKPVDFEAEDFQKMANFQQKIIFVGITPNEDKTKFSVAAKIVTYKTIEDAEFVILNPALAMQFKKALKPYSAIDVWGDISVEKHIEETEVTDVWGAQNEMKRASAPTTRELVITGADPNSIEKEVYSESAIDAAIEKIKASKQTKEEFYGKDKKKDAASGGWGGDLPFDTDDDDDTTGW